MLGLVTKTAVISLILIILVHSLYNFLKTNLTIPKIKDLVNKPDIRYKEIFNKIQKKNNNGCNPIANNKNDNNMKNELKKYIKSLSKEKEKPSKIEPVGSLLGQSMFNNYQQY
tara:strand:+ start:91 stop:429 length:339 start_codon:yes stop_codon:yes gene_type:complete